MIPTPCVCTQCGCEWNHDGFYTYQGEIIQPCKLCRQDTASIYRLNNAEIISERKRQRYYADVEASRSYYRDRKRQQRAQAAQMSRIS